MKFRADYTTGKNPNGSEPWFARWMGGNTLSVVKHCPTPWGARRVEITADPDTYFSVPAECRIRGIVVKGFVMYDDDEGYTFIPYSRFLALCWNLPTP